MSENDKPIFPRVNEIDKEEEMNAQMRNVPGYGPPPMDKIDEQSIVMPKIVVCTSCSARFAEGVKFCGRCGNAF